MESIAKITSKGQTTIPKNVRAALHLAPGDLIVWQVESDDMAVVRRVQPVDFDYLRALDATLSEWIDSADEEAYRDL